MGAFNVQATGLISVRETNVNKQEVRSDGFPVITCTVENLASATNLPQPDAVCYLVLAAIMGEQ